MKPIFLLHWQISWKDLLVKETPYTIRQNKEVEDVGEMNLMFLDHKVPMFLVKMSEKNKHKQYKEPN